MKLYQKEFDAAFYIIQLAAEEISRGYFDNVGSWKKSDGSPVTIIDQKVDAMIVKYLRGLFPSHGFLTEESKDHLSRINDEFVWIIDPIDGTMEFINHQYEFVTNIALCHNHEIVMALISAPLTKEIFYAIKGEGAYRYHNGRKRKIHVSNKTDKLTCLTSPYHMSGDEENYLKEHQEKFKDLMLAGAAYKACLIASGKADVSYRFGANTKEWDTAAPDLLVREAGGYFVDNNRKRIKYNKEDVINHDGFVMANKKENYF